MCCFLFFSQIFSLNARLAAAESMTHDVIRDLLGVKLDMTTYVVKSHVLLLLIVLAFPFAVIFQLRNTRKNISLLSKFYFGKRKGNKEKI